MAGRRRLSANLGVIGFMGIPTAYSDETPETGQAIQAPAVSDEMI
jgi:hypothetical protein